uniref:Uncharacterized protein n=1 Tax=Arundo donax TaxID=35708 RepID=A0A0A8YA32_ARUDO
MLFVDTMFDDILDEDKEEGMVEEVLHLVNSLHNGVAHVAKSQLSLEFSMAESDKGLSGTFNENICNTKLQDQHGSSLRRLLTSMRHESTQGCEGEINIGMSVGIFLVAPISNEMLEWGNGKFSPGETEHRLELGNMSTKQWDPAATELEECAIFAGV